MTMTMVTASSRLVRVRYPWQATIDLTSSWPARFYARLVSQALRYGNPARRRFGAVYVLAARTGVPERPVATLLRAARRTIDRDLESLASAVEAAWPDLYRSARSLPEVAPRLSTLALQRSAGRTVFVFGAGPEPFLVCKVPAGDRARFEAEARALELAAPAGAGPLHLGSVAGAFVQEAVPGAPLRVAPLAPHNAVDLHWGPEHEGMTGALVNLAQKTRHAATPQELNPDVTRAAEKLDGATGRVLRSALADLGTLERSVLRHGDTSPQNCMVDAGRFQAFVDWELARFDGAPGFDIWNAAVACVDHGVGLVRWSEDRALSSFKKAWNGSRFFDRARAAARLSALAAGVPEAAHEKLETAFFGRRLASRLARPNHYATGPETARKMLEFVCAR